MTPRGMKAKARFAAAGIAAAVAAALLVTVPSAAATAPPMEQPKASGANVCTDTAIPQPIKDKPGSLLAQPQDVTTESGIATGRLYRVLYTTTGPAGSVQASCGLIAVPDGDTIKGVIAWAHGTRGLNVDCQPSTNPAGFVGPMYGGIGSPTPKGTQQSGALYGMLTSGSAVVATDYYSQGVGGDDLQMYVLGVAEGLAVIDSARVLTNNPEAFGLADIARNAQIPLIPWGHSQGGGSALWAGQIASQYLSLNDDRTLNLAGVAAIAPATQFTTSPGQPDSYMGKHLGDRDMYNFDPGLPVKIPIGAAFFSYVTTSWSQVQAATEGAMPFGPTRSVDYADILSKSGAKTAPKVAALCLTPNDLLKVLVQVEKYLLPDLWRFFDEPFAGSKVNGKWTGGVDATCANLKDDPGTVREWCQWLQFNMPGPNGVNPYAKVPRNNGGNEVPVYIAQGRNDRIMWCVDDSGKVNDGNCLSAQFYQSMANRYCDGDGALQADYFADVTHFTAPGAAAVNPKTLAYSGSPLDEFVDGALSGSLPRTCSENTLPNPLPSPK